jgi:hypothetical protein
MALGFAVKGAKGLDGCKRQSGDASQSGSEGQARQYSAASSPTILAKTKKERTADASDRSITNIPKALCHQNIVAQHL